MALTDSAIRTLKPRDRAYKISDEKGLYLQVTPDGGASLANEVPRRRWGGEETFVR